MFNVPERFRVKTGVLASTFADGNNGAFWVDSPDFKTRKHGCKLGVIASDGMGWEHISVSLPHRCPTWAEMSHVKELFWEPGDAVIQIHPPRSEYINNHPYCLHLWRKAGTNDFYESPPSFLVGLPQFNRA